MKFQISGRTDVGKRRAKNEDNFTIDSDIGFFVIADGMGGHAHGEVASRLAVEVTAGAMKRSLVNGQKTILGKIDPALSERANQLGSAVRLANQLILESAKSNPAQSGMGTTIDAVLLSKEAAAIAHVGDSRVYRVRTGRLEQLTEDHSLVADQLRRGLIGREEAERSHLKNVLIRALGVEENTSVDVLEIPCAPGDLLIACTDGLNKMVPDEEILKTVLEMKTPKAVSEHLVDLANAAGGVDNVTVVVAQLVP